MSFVGVSSDGISFDGVSFDGVSVVGVSFDGVSSDVMFFDGVSFGAAFLSGVARVGVFFDWEACFDAGESLGLGILLAAVFLDDVVEGAFDLVCEAPPAGRSPEGVETT